MVLTADLAGGSEISSRQKVPYSAIVLQGTGTHAAAARRSGQQRGEIIMADGARLFPVGIGMVPAAWRVFQFRASTGRYPRRSVRHWSDPDLNDRAPLGRTTR